MRSQAPEPFGPMRRRGCMRRREPWTKSAVWCATLLQIAPAVSGSTLEPRTLVMRPASTVTSRLQVSGQSSVQTLARGVARCAFAAGDTVLVEEPGYAPMRFGLAKNGLGVSSVRVDDEGFDLDAAGARVKAKGAVLTPSRQFPLGATLPLTRRLKLLDWVARTGGYLIEDDFDSEY